MSELLVEFKNEAYYNDLLEIKKNSGELSRVGFEFFYEISAKRNGRRLLLPGQKQEWFAITIH